jgi:hypothetical protein
VIPQMLKLVQSGQCWMADANFCTLAFLFGIVDHKAHFIVRQRLAGADFSQPDFPA